MLIKPRLLLWPAVEVVLEEITLGELGVHMVFVLKECLFRMLVIIIVEVDLKLQVVKVAKHLHQTVHQEVLALN